MCSVSAFKEKLLFMEAASVDFEVFGKVQGCNFTKVAKANADRLGLTGWVKNNKTGTVSGRLQGAKISVDEMVKWLSEEGSPGCQIDRCQLTNQQAIIKPDYPSFVLKF